MEWPVILAIALAVPVVLIPLAFVWYLNVSGLYRVISDARQRQRRRVRALKKAGALARSRAAVKGEDHPAKAGGH